MAINTAYVEQSWPRNGTPLFRDVTPPYFLQVTEEILHEITGRIVKAFSPQKIILFGSYAYGKPTPDSDVDLLIIQPSAQSHTEQSVAISELILPRPFPVDILVRTPEEVDKALVEKDFFIKEILEHGRTLYEQPSES